MSIRMSEDGRKVMLDLCELAESMSPEAAQDIVRARFMSKDVMLGLYRHVAGGAFSEAWEGWSLSDDDRQAFREALMPLMDDIAQTAIRNLKREMFQARSEAKRFEDWAWALSRWNGKGTRPELAPYEYVRLQTDDNEAGDRALKAIEAFEAEVTA